MELMKIVQESACRSLHPHHHHVHRGQRRVQDQVRRRRRDGLPRQARAQAADGGARQARLLQLGGDGFRRLGRAPPPAATRLRPEPEERRLERLRGHRAGRARRLAGGAQPAREAQGAFGRGREPRRRPQGAARARGGGARRRSTPRRRRRRSAARDKEQKEKAKAAEKAKAVGRAVPPAEGEGKQGQTGDGAGSGSGCGSGGSGPARARNPTLRGSLCSCQGVRGATTMLELTLPKPQGEEAPKVGLRGSVALRVQSFLNLRTPPPQVIRSQGGSRGGRARRGPARLRARRRTQRRARAPRRRRPAPQRRRHRAGGVPAPRRRRRKWRRPSACPA